MNGGRNEAREKCMMDPNKAGTTNKQASKKRKKEKRESNQSIASIAFIAP
jgi:hypothetical protein